MVSSSDPTSSEPAVNQSATNQSAVDQTVLDELAAQPPSAFWSVFLSTFITIFLAELGDKTQVAILLMSAGSQSPLIVFIGAGLALIATSLLGVLLGQWLSKRIAPATLDTCAGILLLLITIGLVGDIVGQ